MTAFDDAFDSLVAELNTIELLDQSILMKTAPELNNEEFERRDALGLRRNIGSDISDSVAASILILLENEEESVVAESLAKLILAVDRQRAAGLWISLLSTVAGKSLAIKFSPEMGNPSFVLCTALKTIYGFAIKPETEEDFMANCTIRRAKFLAKYSNR